MVGIDVVAVERIKKAIGNPRFVERVFTKKEYTYYKIRDNAETLAGFYAAKEAFCKAFGVGIDPGIFSEIEVDHDPSGAPFFNLSGRAKELCGEKKVYVSISHDGGIAVAAVSVE